MSETLSRRAFLKAAAVGAAGAAFAPSRAGQAASRTASGAAASFRLGVASYSLRRFSRAEAIAMIQALGTPYVSVKSFHLPYEHTPDELAAAARAFSEAGLRLVSCGVNNIREDDDAHIRPFFDYARAAGIPMLVIAPTPENLARIEGFVRRYDLPVAIHNHGPEDPHFPTPQAALEQIRGMDPRVGLCVDVGHTARTGADVVKALAEAGDRLLDLHMKDLRDLREAKSQCIVGEGAMPVADLFRQLQRMDYRGCVNLEYEIDPDDPLPGMQRSFAYLRGVLAGLGQR